ncbi:flagellar assembly protein FliW [Paenibacillus turpanensis]|uniref:flagellar assembly protein FliW n=1 Tax=Paenibacillus turpanensis TaxID=2689078 RepID=UPI00140CC6A9|nr:flagellar assembly protein FliW [Paenibacillus turpanensis]
MKLDTSRFGEIDVSDEAIIEFKEGIPGFEDQRYFTVITVEDHEPFSYLQSIDNGELSFIIVDPFEYFPDYDFHLSESDVKQLQIEGPEQIIVRTIVSIRGELDNATTNLVAPIVLQVDTRQGKQIILTNTEYTTRHRLFPAVVEK